LRNVSAAERALVERIRAALTVDLLEPKSRLALKGIANVYTDTRSHCYVASEAFFHAAGGAVAGWRVRRQPIAGRTHWWLERGDDELVDVTADQFAEPVDYSAGTTAAFLTPAPSKRCRVVLERIAERGG
jgi:hypothetical protein